MKKIIIVLITIYLCSIFLKKDVVNNEVPNNEGTFFNIMVNLKNDDETITLPLEEYIIGVVSAEMPASFEMEALKALATSARTYAINRLENGVINIENSSNTQNYQSNAELYNKWQENFTKYYYKIRKAVYDTKGKIITYDNKPIKALYFSMSNGYTEDSELVFNEKLPYLVSVSSPLENETLNNFKYQKEFTKEEFCYLLNISCENIEISDIEKSKTNHVLNIVINNHSFTGRKIRELLSLRSTDFDIILNDKIVIITKGYGHDVGLSEYGSNLLAKNGYNYEDILKYYYQNTIIDSIN